MNLMKTELKRNLLFNFCLNNSLKDSDNISVLTYLKNRDELLENLHFVDDATNFKNYLIISADNVEGPPLTFVWNGNEPQYSASDIISSFRLLEFLPKKVDLYIQLNFNSKNNSMLYQTVNENSLDCNNNEDDEEIEDKELVEEFVSQLLLSNERINLLKLIDDALDNKDETQFLKLTTFLKDIS